jgi:hypothetical protein
MLICLGKSLMRAGSSLVCDEDTGGYYSSMDVRVDLEVRWWWKVRCEDA